MELILGGIARAAQLLFLGDPEVWAITWLTLRVSGSATFISLLIGVPLGTFLALAAFPGRRLALSLVNAGMGLPPVVAGLWVSIFLWRSGPLGFLHLMYTPAAMVTAQAVIASPVVTGLTAAAIQQVNPRLQLQMLALGASPPQFLWLLLREARLSLLAAVMAGFGAVVSEVGASMMVGGNILGQTRVLTTATVMEVSRGHFDLAIALSLILMGLAFAISAALTFIQHRGERRWPA